MSEKRLGVEPKSIEQLAQELAELDPRILTNFTPDNLDLLQDAFLKGEITGCLPGVYSQLDSIDFDQKDSDYQQMSEAVRANPLIPPKQHHIYEAYIARNRKVNRLMSMASAYRQATAPAQKEIIARTYQALNVELYGEPKLEFAQSMVHEVLAETDAIEDGQLQSIRQEFIARLPDEFKRSPTEDISLKPDASTQRTAQLIAESIYAPLLKHADELIGQAASEKGQAIGDLRLGPTALAAIFQTVIDREFLESGWRVMVKPANAVKVDPSTKIITVPEKRAPVSADKARGLVVHELGVHMLRSIIGEGSDLIPMQLGFAESSDAEEGLAKVMETVISGEETRPGYQYYLTLSLLNRGYNFAEAFEVMWRYKVLDAYLEKAADITPAFVNSQKKAAFKFMFRTVRGTNDLPFHKDLVYFDGPRKIWDYIARHESDPDLVNILYIGKIDPTNSQHVWGALDAKSRIKQS